MSAVSSPSSSPLLLPLEKSSSSLAHVPFSSLPHPGFSFAASLSSPTSIPSFSTYFSGPFTCSPASPSPLPASLSASSKSQQIQLRHSEAERVIEAWSKTFQPHFAAFVLFCNGTGVVFLKKNLTRLTSSSSSSENREKGVLCDRAMGLLQHTGYLSPSRQVSTSVNRLKGGLGWMIHFNNNPHILTFVPPTTASPSPGPSTCPPLHSSSSSSLTSVSFSAAASSAASVSLQEMTDHKLLAQIGFMRRNLDVTHLNILHVQMCTYDSAVPTSSSALASSPLPSASSQPLLSHSKQCSPSPDTSSLAPSSLSSSSPSSNINLVSSPTPSDNTNNVVLPLPSTPHSSQLPLLIDNDILSSVEKRSELCEKR